MHVYSAGNLPGNVRNLQVDLLKFLFIFPVTTVRG